MRTDKKKVICEGKDEEESKDEMKQIKKGNLFVQAFFLQSNKANQVFLFI